MNTQQVILVSLAISVFSSHATAQDYKKLTDELSNCVKILDNSKRLTCFDTFAKQTITQQSINIKVQSETVNTIKAQQIDDFAKDDLKKSKEEQGPDSIIAIISKTKKLIRGQWVIDLQNGQKWQQMDSVKIKLEIGEKIRLKKGSLGSVYLYKEESNRGIRVKRLK